MFTLKIGKWSRIQHRYKVGPHDPHLSLVGAHLVPKTVTFKRSHLFQTPSFRVSIRYISRGNNLSLPPRQFLQATSITFDAFSRWWRHLFAGLGSIFFSWVCVSTQGGGFKRLFYVHPLLREDERILDLYVSNFKGAVETKRTYKSVGFLLRSNVFFGLYRSSLLSRNIQHDMAWPTHCWEESVKQGFPFALNSLSANHLTQLNTSNRTEIVSMSLQVPFLRSW